MSTKTYTRDDQTKAENKLTQLAAKLDELENQTLMFPEIVEPSHEQELRKIRKQIAQQRITLAAINQQREVDS